MVLWLLLLAVDWLPGMLTTLSYLIPTYCRERKYQKIIPAEGSLT